MTYTTQELMDKLLWEFSSLTTNFPCTIEREEGSSHVYIADGFLERLEEQINEMNKNRIFEIDGEYSEYDVLYNFFEEAVSLTI